MRKSPLVIILLSLLAFACKKSGNQPLNGKWKLVETWMNAGAGPDIIEPAPADSFYVDFKSNGSFKSNIPTYNGFTSYEITGVSEIRLLRPVTSSAPAETIVYRIKKDGLKISRISCIEGCGESYKSE